MELANRTFPASCGECRQQLAIESHRIGTALTLTWVCIAFAFCKFGLGISVTANQTISLLINQQKCLNAPLEHVNVIDLRVDSLSLSQLITDTTLSMWEVTTTTYKALSVPMCEMLCWRHGVADK